jgi:ABC-type uncharacterized transport system involved in gliding motility auxiliary subunit
MEGKMMKKYAALFGVIGLVLVLVGLIIYSINSVMTAWTWAPAGVGLLLLIAYIVLAFNEIKEGLSSRSTKFGSNAALMIVVVLGLVIVINILLSRFNYRLDTTAAKQFSLADQTRKVLTNLKKDIKVYGFFKSGEDQMPIELLTEYSNVSQRFKYEIADPDKKPGLAKKYNIRSYGTMVLDCEGKEERLEKSDEESLTNALIKVTREGEKKIYFTSGHGEKDIDNTERTGYASAKEAITAENYKVEKILLAERDSIPNDCSVLILAGPKTDLFPKEQTMINKYLDHGGKVLFLLEPESGNSYVEFLKAWGYKIGHNIVIDASGIGQLFGAGPTIPVVSTYEKHPITQEFSVMTFFPEARSVSKDDNPPSGITVTELAKTNARSWGEVDPLSTGKISFDEGKDLKGPVTVLTVAEKSITQAQTKNNAYGLENGPLMARLAVFGDSDFPTNGYFKVQGNGDLFLNSMNWLAEEEDLISIRARDPEDRRINLTQQQSRILLYLGVIVMPLLILSSGVWVYRNRKKG